MIISYSPEIIADETADVTDEEVEAYVDVVMWDIDSHIVLWAEEEDGHVRHRRIMDEWQQDEIAAFEMLTTQLALVELRRSLAQRDADGQWQRGTGNGS